MKKLVRHVYKCIVADDNDDNDADSDDDDDGYEDVEGIA